MDMEGLPILPPPDPYGNWVRNLSGGWVAKTLVEVDQITRTMTLIAHAAFYDGDGIYAFAVCHDGIPLVVKTETQRERDFAAQSFAAAVVSDQIKVNLN